MDKSALLVIFAIPCFALAQSNAHVDAGMSVSREYLDKFGNPQNFESLIVNPMLGEGELETTNGEKAFRAPMTCGSDVPFASVTLGILPSGDMNLAAVSVDTNQDGSFDQVLSSLPAISGVCSNGYVACDLGSWNNCDYYQWSTIPNGGLAANAVSVRDVGSCQCINDSCAPNYSSINFETVLTQVGASVSQALAQRDYSLAVTKVDVNGPTITYYGQTISECGGATVVAQNYFSNPNNMDQAIDTTLGADLPESRIYDLARNSQSATEVVGTVTYENCSIVREPSLDEVSLLDIVSIGAGTASADLVNANTVDITVGRIGDNYLNAGGCRLFEQTAQLAIFRPDRIVSAELQHVKYDDHMQVIVNNNLIWNGPYGNWTDTEGLVPWPLCERKESNDLNAVSVNVLNHFPSSPGTLDVKLRVQVGNWGEGYARIRVGVNTECREGQDAIINSCQGYEQSSGCRLRNETIDGVTTVSNFARTGLQTLPQSSVLSSPTCELPITRDWMSIQRTYECDQTNAFDLEQAAKRVHTVESSTNETGYIDLRASQAGNTPLEISGELSVFDEIPVERCTLQCKVRKVRHANDVTVFGLTSDELEENRRSEVTFRQCVENNCVLDDDEEMVQECGCINGFNDVAIMMQLIRMAGSDMICSSGQRQEP
jgi:hypothetical protein